MRLPYSCPQTTSSSSSISKSPAPPPPDRPPDRHAMATPGVSDGVVVETDYYRYVGQVRTGTKTLHGRGTCTWKKDPNKGKTY